jgi:hypothetical protein
VGDLFVMFKADKSNLLDFEEMTTLFHDNHILIDKDELKQVFSAINNEGMRGSSGKVLKGGMEK